MTQTVPQFQYLMMGISGLLLVAVLVIIKMLWGLRGPVFTLIGDYVNSELGGISVAGALRRYLTTPEGKTFMEGVINGKVRRELSDHDDKGSSHYKLMKDYATVKEVNEGLDSVRKEAQELRDRCDAADSKRAEALRQLEEMHGLIMENRDILDKRFTELEQLLQKMRE